MLDTLLSTKIYYRKLWKKFIAEKNFLRVNTFKKRLKLLIKSYLFIERYKKFGK
jgi:hypothetical protein